jgi:hypothetical protein
MPGLRPSVANSPSGVIEVGSNEVGTHSTRAAVLTEDNPFLLSGRQGPLSSSLRTRGGSSPKDVVNGDAPPCGGATRAGHERAEYSAEAPAGRRLTGERPPSRESWTEPESGPAALSPLVAQRHHRAAPGAAPGERRRRHPAVAPKPAHHGKQSHSQIVGGLCPKARSSLSAPYIKCQCPVVRARAAANSAELRSVTTPFG